MVNHIHKNHLIPELYSGIITPENLNYQMNILDYQDYPCYQPIFE